MNITLDLGHLMPADFVKVVGEQLVQECVQAIGDSAQDYWMQLAGNSLHSTRREYLRGIQRLKVDPGQFVMTLVGILPNGIENGMDALDLHDILLGPDVPVLGPGEKGKGKRKRKGGGFYRVINFRHAGPNAGYQAGTPMGKPYAGHPQVADSHKLGHDIYKAAQKLVKSVHTPGGGSNWGGYLPAGMAPKLKPEHDTDIYARMTKNVSGTAGGHTQYTTFRTISTGSPGWVRGPTQGVHLLAQVEQHVMRMAPVAFESFVAGLKT